MIMVKRKTKESGTQYQGGYGKSLIRNFTVSPKRSALIPNRKIGSAVAQW